MKEKPEAIMINMPLAYFQEKREDVFRRYYESMGNGENGYGCFYHWISCVPVHEVTTVYVCFMGKVQYKATVVMYLKDRAPFEGWEKRNYLVTTGPVQKPPHEIPQKGFRGFRYCKQLF